MVSLVTWNVRGIGPPILVGVRLLRRDLGWNDSGFLITKKLHKTLEEGSVDDGLDEPGRSAMRREFAGEALNGFWGRLNEHNVDSLLH
jgi:hypothetical protein